MTATRTSRRIGETDKPLRHFTMILPDGTVRTTSRVSTIRFAVWEVHDPAAEARYLRQRAETARAEAANPLLIALGEDPAKYSARMLTEAATWDEHADRREGRPVRYVCHAFCATAKAAEKKALLTHVPTVTIPVVETKES